MDRFLHLRIKILHAERRAIETDFAQRNDVFAREPARINFNSGLDVVGELKIFVDDAAELADFVGREKCRRAAAPMQLDDFAFRIQPRGHLCDFFFEIIQIRRALRVVFGDDRRAARKTQQSVSQNGI